MRRCPTCNRTYTDDSLVYCLTDGAPLAAATPLRTEPVTPAHSGPLHPGAKTTEVLRAPVAPKAKRSVLPFVIIAALAAGLVLMTYLYFTKGENSRLPETTAQSNRTVTVQQPTPTPTPAPTTEANASSSPLPAETTTPGPVSSPDGTKTASAPPAQNASSPKEVEAGSFLFEFKQCKLSGIAITCDVTITSQGLDRVLYLDRNTRLFDDADNEYECKQVKVGNTQGDAVERKFVAGERTGVSLTFEQVSIKATKVTLLDIVGRPRNADNFRAQFRNFPIVR